MSILDKPTAIKEKTSLARMVIPCGAVKPVWNHVYADGIND
jgi:hypothetical protein